MRTHTIIFLDGSDAEQPLNLISQGHKSIALKWLRDNFYLGYQQEISQQQDHNLPTLTQDLTYQDGNFIMYWNIKEGYIGLELIT